MRIRSTLLLLFIATAAAAPTDHVDTFIGTTNGGHVFAGATLPFGSVKAVADCTSSDHQAGFVSDDSDITGISQLHDDGTGGSPSLGNFQLFPQVCPNALESCKTTSFERQVSRVNGTAAAQPGYFSIELASRIKSEVTVTQHVALHRFTFLNLSSSASPKSARASGDLSPDVELDRPVDNSHERAETLPVATILVDVTNDLQRSFQAQGDIALDLKLSGTKSGAQFRVRGDGTFLPSFGVGTYKVYFCLDVPGVQNATIYREDTISAVPGPMNLTLDDFRESGVLLSISPSYLASHSNSIQTRIGISWRSSLDACKFAESEIPDGKWGTDEGFESVRSTAKSKWNDVLGSVEVGEEGVTPGTLTTFWTSLYRSYISPMNLTGDNPLWSSQEPFYDSFYCIWDSFRVVHPLYSIAARNVQTEVVRAMLDIYRNAGFLPDCRMSTCKGFSQGGSNADTLLTDSWVKGIGRSPTSGVNWTTALEAVVKDATVTPSDWQVEGRGGIERRKRLGYIPQDDDTPGGLITRSCSRTLEDSYNDFGISTLARGMGNTPLANKFQSVSNDWKNLWNPRLSDSGFTGFIQPRLINGSFDFQDPKRCSPQLDHNSCFLNSGGGEFYEASSWEYSFYVPHDMASLLKLMGGSDNFVRRLDAFFDLGFHDIGDEPGFLPCFLYNYAGRPDKSVDRSLAILRKNYNNTLGGLPGNDDSGAMGGFVVFNSFGFFPVAGTSVYLLTTPLFPSITITDTLTNTKARFIARNFDNAQENRYIQSMSINGMSVSRNWFAHDEVFGKGAVVELVLGPKPSQTWGRGQLDLPPSMSTGGRFTGMVGV